MSQQDELKNLLIEIRDNQREAIARQKEQLELSKQQLERSNTQVKESLELQREAVQKARTVGKIALPGIVICLALIIYLVVRFF